MRIALSAPRIRQEEWGMLDGLSKWLIAIRARFLIMTLLSCAIGGLLAFKVDKFHFLNWLLCTNFFIFAHATGNILNDLIDYLLGIDSGDYLRLHDEPHPLAHNLMNLKEHIFLTLATGVLALVSGIYLIHQYGHLSLLLFLLAVFFLLFYTYPLKHIGLGEMVIFVVWGPLMVGGSYFFSSGEWSWRVVLASTPYALAVTAVLLGDHLDKYKQDRAKGIRTLPVILGEKKTRILTITTLLFQYLTLFYLVATRFFSPVMFLVLFTFPSFLKAVKILEAPMPQKKPNDLGDFAVDTWPRWFRAVTFWHTIRFGTAFLAALIIDVILSRYILIL